jgi:hypothetical protein
VTKKLLNLAFPVKTRQYRTCSILSPILRESLPVILSLATAMEQGYLALETFGHLLGPRGEGGVIGRREAQGRRRREEEIPEH